jgi:2-succinyl-6-hydroxy-2,4-cyclohexadiene-1-carboxylate synthase
VTTVHGFLGLPSDWDCVLEGPRQNLNWLPEFLDLPGGELTPALPPLAEKLNAQACETTSDTLIGYSMGGRIALHMLLADRPPYRWRRAIIVSASTGIVSSAERRRRWDQDRRWAERFRLEEWTSLLGSWESQAVFKGEPDLERRENDFDRGQLAAALLRGSVGAQEDLRPALSKLEVPILWLAGDRDLKYNASAQDSAKLNPRFECRIVADAGHRLPWSNTQGFKKAVSDFLGK